MKTCILFAFAFLLLVSCSNKTQIAQWKGINRDGIFDEPGLLTNWPESGPGLIWSNNEIGNGYGSVAVSGNQVFVNGEVDSISYLFSFNSRGELLWKSENGKEYVGEGFSSSFPGSRSTPTVVNDLVYTCSGLGRIACYTKSTGEEKWAIDMKGDFNGIPNYFGYTESVLTDEGKLFCFPGGKDTNVVALDRFTGKPIWISKALGDTVSYCSPMLINLPGKKILVTFSLHNLMGIDAATGELLWSHEQKPNEYNQHCNTPIYNHGCLYYVSGQSNGAVKLKISDNGEHIEEAWRTPVEGNSFYGFLVLNNKLYSTTRKTKLIALDINSGREIDSVKVKNGTIIAANNMIYCYSDNGKVSLIDISGENMSLLSDFKCDKGTKEHFSSPVISNGVLYIRHGNTLMAYNIKQS